MASHERHAPIHRVRCANDGGVETEGANVCSMGERERCINREKAN